jgi:hypothetical protein
MSNAEQRKAADEQQKQSDAGVERAHVEREPVPGHPENIPVDGGMRPSPDGSPSAGPVAGPVEQGEAPSAGPDTKPGTPPGTQSERDRLRGSS